MRAWLIKKLGGFTEPMAVKEFITHARSLSTTDKHKLLTAAIRKSFNTISVDDILRVKEDGQWMFEGKPLSDQQKKVLIQNAQNFTEGMLWKVLDRELQYHANKRMFILSASEQDMIAGKVLVYLTDIIRTKLKSLGGKSKLP